MDAAHQQAGHPVRVEFVVDGADVQVIAVTPAELRGAALVAHVARLAAQGAVTDVQALDLVDDGDLGRALTPVARVTGLPVVCHGLGVAPGIVSGVAVFSTPDAVAARAEGAHPVLILPTSRPADLPGLLAAAAVVTEHGGSTSHAAVVTRGLGRVCVTALTDARVDPGASCLRPAAGDPIVAGDGVTVDGHTGRIHRGAAEATQATVADGVAPAVDWLLTVADRYADLPVRVNADTPADAEAGRAGGATGIGLCRIEHMLLGDRQPLLARALTGAGTASGGEALAELRDILRADFVAMLRVMDGRPVTVRLLDPPRHEFLPDLVGLEVAAAVADSRGESGPDPVRLAAVRRLWESNPMLGVRGVRLAALDPLLLAVQVTALVEATARVRRDGGDPRPELLVPMVTVPAELDLVRAALRQAYDSLGLAGRVDPMPVGAMVETPRAALVAGALARVADFLSIGSNDLTALVWGLSRDDAERELLPRYQDLGLITDPPTVRWDDEGVGSLVRHAVDTARRVKPGIGIGVCGEQAVDPVAVRLLRELRVGYLSCSPARLPVVRLTAARAALDARRDGEA
ncbi:putative PEP-binding protein [Micromonospora sp. CPCC 206060]|uniref:putative PEP-binding protein n=1 Tax=Micromonospora sp. CPCC 206060 TaxID=3122406 RepID=UPI002FF13D24